MKRADELEKKLKAAETALEEAQIAAKSEEKRREEEATRIAGREEDLRKRLDSLNTSLTSKFG